MTDYLIDTDTSDLITLETGDTYTLLAGVTHSVDDADWLIDVVGSDVDIHVSGVLLNLGGPEHTGGGTIRIAQGADNVTLTLTDPSTSMIYSDNELATLLVAGDGFAMNNASFLVEQTVDADRKQSRSPRQW